MIGVGADGARLGHGTVADPVLRPGVEPGWYVPHPLPDLGDPVDRGTGFALCLVDPTALLLTSVEPAEDGTEVSVRPGGPPGCGEPPPAGLRRAMRGASARR